MSVEPVHDPRRPEWTCRVCPDGTPWPCPPARTQLAEAYGSDRAGLATDMAEALHYATVEAPDTPGDLYQRFILWTRWSPVERCRSSWRRRSL